jgi:hypothetical protein
MKLVPLLIISLLGFGCAAKQMTARNADILLELQIEKKLPLYSSQKKQLKQDVDQFLNDQKPFAREAIPLITSIQLDVSKVDEQYGQLNALYLKLALNFSKLMSKYMALLDDKQQKDFEKKLKDENQTLKYSKANDRIEKVEDRFETLFGTISDKQIKVLKTYKPHFKERHALRLDRRQKLHARFSEIYKMDISPQSRSNYFYEAFAEYQSSYPETPKNIEIIKNIIPTLSKEQKEVFEDKTNDLKDILNYYLEAHY